MATTLFKGVTYSLPKLVQAIEMGEISSPNIRQPLVWKISELRDRFDSTYL
jgi:hypothetical protein